MLKLFRLNFRNFSTNIKNDINKTIPNINNNIPPSSPSSPSNNTSNNNNSNNNKILIEAAKENIDQSPWKMNFLIKLARDKWVPDALAQLKFSAKHKAQDVARILERAVAIARVRHQAIPEELHVNEIVATKGKSHKKVRVMGRGRAGFGTMRWTHVKLKVELIDFDERILKAETNSEKNLWIKRKTLVEKLKANPPEYIVKGKKASRRNAKVPEPVDPEQEQQNTAA